MEGIMKNLKKIFAVAITLMLLITGVFSTLSVSAAPATFEFDLTLGNIKSDCYEFMAYNIANNELKPLETEQKPTWSPDWPGHFVVGETYNVLCKTERASTCIIDLIPRTAEQFVPAVVFTAPKDGKYNVIPKLDKLYGNQNNGTSYVDIMLIKGSTGEVLLKEEKLEKGELSWVKKNIELAEGEKVFVIVVLNPESTRSGGHNVGLVSLLVNESVEQSTTPIPTKPKDTSDPDASNAPEEGNDGASNGDIDPIIIVACVGGALVVVAIIIVVVVASKKKKNKK